jgi:N-acetylmuramoyl-L-alanine amidase
MQSTAQLGFPDRGTSHSGFGITMKPKMPSALTEAWFLSNDALASQYLSEKAAGFPPGNLVDREAQGLANAVVCYFAPTSSACPK